MGVPLTRVSVQLKGHIDLRGFFAVDDSGAPASIRLKAPSLLSRQQILKPFNSWKPQSMRIAQWRICYKLFLWRSLWTTSKSEVNSDLRRPADGLVSQKRWWILHWFIDQWSETNFRPFHVGCKGVLVKKNNSRETTHWVHVWYVIYWHLLLKKLDAGKLGCAKMSGAFKKNAIP